MASAILHIKDTYYFEVPKALWRSQRGLDTTQDARKDFPQFWIRLDPDFQLWQAKNLYDESLQKMPDAEVPQWSQLKHDFAHWQHHGHNASKPLPRYLREAEEAEWFQSKVNDTDWVQSHEAWLSDWEDAVKDSRDTSEYIAETPEWSEKKIEGYNKVLSGKILIPQPFGTLNNLYEAHSGFCISKFMVVQLFVALLIGLVFIRLAQRVKDGGPPKGRLWNMLEAVLLFIRDEIARPSIGKGADQFVPLLWTMFLFILLMNLFGILPWAGAPTGAFAVTAGMAVVTLFTVVIMGFVKLGPAGFFGNFIPPVDLDWYLKPLEWLIKIVIFAIEILGMLIRHGVLAVRLLANMVAGHLVLLGFLYIAFSAEGAAGGYWWIAAPISLIGSTLFLCLELFVAFLQAYIFTFLSALFIGSAVHHHH